MGKLFIDVLPFEYGKSFGYQEYIFNLLDYIYNHTSDIFFDKIIIVCMDSQKKHFDKYLGLISIRTYACSSVIKRLFTQTLLPFYLGVTRQDVIVFTANYSSLLKRCKHILVIHDLLFKRKALFPYRLMRLQRSLYLPISIKLADRIIAISEFTATDIERFYPRSKSTITVIYNYFNFNKYPLLDNSVSKENLFITVCSTAYHKNTLTVLNAFEKYCIKGGTYDLILVGSLRKGTSLYKEFNSLDTAIRDRINLYEKISNTRLAELYQKSRVYISASLFEGLGMPIVEAMYFNLPIVVSDYQVFHEVSLNKGIYFSPLDSDQLTEIMISIEISKPICSYSDNVKEVYSEKQTSERYIQLINSFV